MRKIAAIVLLLSAVLSERGRADYIRLGGRIDATFFRPDGSVETKQVIPFDIFLTETGERWMIRSRFEPGREWHDETEGIGQAVYSVHYDPAANPGSSLSANVYPGYYPYWHFYHVTVPWIVYCSSEYFKHEAPENLPFPSFNAAWEGRAYAFKAEVGFLTNTVLKLPDSIEWTADAGRIASANHAATLRVPLGEDEANRQRMDLRYLVKVGLVAGKYTVSSVTNFNGYLLPESFHFVAI